MNPWSYLAHVRNCRLMLEADKGGAGGSSAKTDLEQLTEAREENKKLKTDLDAANALTEETAATLKIEKENAEKVAKDLTAANEKATKAADDLKLEQEKSNKLSADLTAANEKATKAEADLKTADERAETKLREIDARAGGTLPKKDHSAGNFTQEKQIDDKAKPQDRLAAIFNAARK